MSQPFIKEQYEKQIRKQLQEKLGLKNVHQVPRLEKIVLNSGFGVAKEKSWPQEIRKELTLIAGQGAVITKARKSISNFKLREGMPIGAKVTLRGSRMYDFFYRMVAIALPNIRDFRGMSPKMDGSGNYNLGITDSSIFPEVRGDGHSRETIGLDVTIVTSASHDKDAFELLKALGVPFRKPAITPQVA